MLIELRNYLRSHGRTSMLDLSNRYRMNEDALRGMLDHWIRKGNVVRHIVAECPHRGGCCNCGGTCFEFYEWVDGKAPAADRRA